MVKRLKMEDKKGKKIRKFIRVTYSIPVFVETSDMTIPSAQAELSDISGQGVKLVVSEKLHSGLLVKLHLKTEKEATLVGHVRWQKKINDGYRVGIIFDESYSEQNNMAVELITTEIINEIKERQK